MKVYQIYDYINWRRNHIDENTGKYKKPRKKIIKNGINLKNEQLLSSEKEEIRLRYWLDKNPRVNETIKKYANADITKMKRRFKNIRIKPKKYQERVINFDVYLDWIRQHTNKETGKISKPNQFIYRDGKFLKFNEMTEEDKFQIDLYNWWLRDSQERYIIKKYKEFDLEDIPEEDREIVKKYRDAVETTIIEKKQQKIEQLDELKFKTYIEWKKQHKIEHYMKYTEPRHIILNSEGKLKKIEEMTEEEKLEYVIGKWWYNKPLERKILEKYRYITNSEFHCLSDEEKKVIIEYYKSGIKDIYNIIERMQINLSPTKENDEDWER